MTEEAAALIRRVSELEHMIANREQRITDLERLLAEKQAEVNLLLKVISAANGLRDE